MPWCSLVPAPYTPSCLHECFSGAKIIYRGSSSHPGQEPRSLELLTMPPWQPHRGEPAWATTDPQDPGCPPERAGVHSCFWTVILPSSVLTKTCNWWGTRSFHFTMALTEQVGPPWPKAKFRCQVRESSEEKIMRFPFQSEEKTCSTLSSVSKLSI